jgi:hypothetical protein
MKRLDEFVRTFLLVVLLMAGAALLAMTCR